MKEIIEARSDINQEKDCHIGIHKTRRIGGNKVRIARYVVNT